MNNHNKNILKMCIASVLLFALLAGPASASNFNSTWDTTLTSTGSSNADQIKLPLESGGNYNFTVDWGDSSGLDTITAYDQANVTHTYASAGEYNISINGTISGWRFNTVGDRMKITDVSQWGDLNLGNSKGYFYGCSNLDVTASDSLNLTDTTTLYQAFCGCSGLTSLDVSNWDISNVSSFFMAFDGCTALTSLNTTKWDTANVTSFKYAFRVCSGLTTLDTSGWNTANVDSFYLAFSGCSGLTSLNTTNWDTGNVESFRYAFYNCAGLTSLNTSGWDTRKVTTLEYAFHGCSGLTSLDVSNWDTANVTIFRYAFHGCSGLTSLNTSGWDTGNATTFYLTFNDCFGLTSLNTSGWDTSKVTTFYGTFYDCAGITSVDTTNWDITSLTGAASMFSGVTLDTSSYNTLLTNFAGQTVNNAVTFHGGNSQYSQGAPTVARNDTLMGVYGWTIQDGGQYISLNNINFAWSGMSASPTSIYLQDTSVVTCSVNDSDGTIGLVYASINGINYTMGSAGGDNWTYTYTPLTEGTRAVLFYAQDDVGAWNSTDPGINIIATF